MNMNLFLIPNKLYKVLYYSKDVISCISHSYSLDLLLLHENPQEWEF